MQTSSLLLPPHTTSIRNITFLPTITHTITNSDTDTYTQSKSKVESQRVQEQEQEQEQGEGEGQRQRQRQGQRQREERKSVVQIAEVECEGNGFFVWPSALLLAQYIWENPLIIQNKHLLELGCGCGLPSMLSVMMGCASMTATDHDRMALENAYRTCLLNHITPITVPTVITACNNTCSNMTQDTSNNHHGCDTTNKANTSTSDDVKKCPPTNQKTLFLTEWNWGSFPATILHSLPHQLDLILGADIFYDAKDYDDILSCVYYLGVPLLTVFQHRGEGKRHLSKLLPRWNLHMQTISFTPLADLPSTTSAYNDTDSVHQKKTAESTTQQLLSQLHHQLEIVQITPIRTHSRSHSPTEPTAHMHYET